MTLQKYSKTGFTQYWVRSKEIHVSSYEFYKKNCMTFGYRFRCLYDWTKFLFLLYKLHYYWSLFGWNTSSLPQREFNGYKCQSNDLDERLVPSGTSSSHSVTSTFNSKDSIQEMDVIIELIIITPCFISADKFYFFYYHI